MIMLQQVLTWYECTSDLECSKMQNVFEWSCVSKFVYEWKWMEQKLLNIVTSKKSHWMNHGTNLNLLSEQIQNIQFTGMNISPHIEWSKIWTNEIHCGQGWSMWRHINWNKSSSFLLTDLFFTKLKRDIF